jgi:hypothetical protein
MWIRIRIRIRSGTLVRREHSALQNMNFLNFFLLWVIFALLDPDPLTRLNPDPVWIRIRNPGRDISG